ncbi:MAG: hypothetical protein IPG04_17305 [Polyangiaceae bacterium]|nr:hypothetical protein [Polyangiaceae bacterium]
MPAAHPQRQRFVYSRKSWSLLNGSEVFAGIKEMSIDVTVDGRDRPFGTGTKSQGVTRGELKVEGEITFFLEPFMDFYRANPGLLGLLFDSFTGAWLEGEASETVTLQLVTFDSIGNEVAGTEATEVKVKIAAQDFLINGVSVMPGDALGGSTADAGAS